MSKDQVAVNQWRITGYCCTTSFKSSDIDFPRVYSCLKLSTSLANLAVYFQQISKLRSYQTDRGQLSLIPWLLSQAGILQ